jgi:hypothetical protein
MPKEVMLAHGLRAFWGVYKDIARIISFKLLYILSKATKEGYEICAIGMHGSYLQCVLADHSDANSLYH